MAESELPVVQTNSSLQNRGTPSWCVKNCRSQSFQDIHEEAGDSWKPCASMCTVHSTMLTSQACPNAELTAPACQLRRVKASASQQSTAAVCTLGKSAAMEWETSKENFQPLKQGRKPAQLETVKPFQTRGSDSVEEQRRCACQRHYYRSAAGLQLFGTYQLVFYVMQDILERSSQLCRKRPPGSLAAV